jgi:hypothetical protein
VIRALWQAHRPFILRVAIGLALFLVLMNIAVAYRSDGRDQSAKLQNDLLGISQQLRQRDGVHLQHQRSADVLEERVADVLARLSLSAHATIRPPEASEPPSTDFPKRKEKDVYAAFTDRADRIHLSYPPLPEIDFDLRSDLTAEEWADRYALLEVLRRILDAGVECQVDRFRSLRPGAVVSEPVRDDPELAILRFPVAIEMESTYPELLAFLGAFQGDRRFLSVEIDEVTPVPGGEGKVLALLVAAGIELGPPRESTGPRPGRRPR